MPGRGNCASNELIQVDLHVHTRHSTDALSTPQEVISAAQHRGLGAIAVTDHNAIEGAFELQRMAPFPVIVGEEILTTNGEIIGLFLKEHIPAGLTPATTASRIREQGGLVYIPHPFDLYRDSRLDESALLTILEQVDVLEVLNARVTLPVHNARARQFASEHGLLSGAGSDAHTPFEIGQAYVELRAFADKTGFLQALATARVGGSLSLPHVHLFSTWAKLQRRGGT